MNTKKWAAAIFFVGIALLVAGGVNDAVTASRFHFEISTSTNSVQEKGITPVMIKVRVMDSAGKLRIGDRIYGLTTYGTLKAVRVLTDSKGEAEFIFYPSQTNSVNQAQDDLLHFYDETVSKVIQIPPKASYLIKIMKSETDQPKRITSDAFF
ncbi:hypothetical protein EHS13_03850 [Paenibacillus psychroresistens]|uniref:Uncharacterized protein n=1 Tax=Paenibacillus psychroresistens TaxID=1778678 RepID=A0A6B8RFA1_9BACL|nr:hypothetical protein [Paenibacillus psychroresistens]QGQ94098.1 hypothetical protein EHS13_03850 [Paenibacillus psychroresistens]